MPRNDAKAEPVEGCVGKEEEVLLRAGDSDISGEGVRARVGDMRLGIDELLRSTGLFFFVSLSEHRLLLSQQHEASSACLLFMSPLTCITGLLVLLGVTSAAFGEEAPTQVSTEGKEEAERAEEGEGLPLEVAEELEEELRVRREIEDLLHEHAKGEVERLPCGIRYSMEMPRRPANDAIATSTNSCSTAGPHSRMCFTPALSSDNSSPGSPADVVVDIVVSSTSVVRDKWSLCSR